MAKRLIRPAVEPRVRREWLRRAEEDGESPTQIAEADHYDVRTVRKHIEREQQEREKRDARATVLRRALEWHYNDLCTFAKKLQTEVAKEDGALAALEDERMWGALYQHVPRSSIWRNLDRLVRTREEIGRLASRMDELFLEQVQTRPPLAFADRGGETGLYADGIVPAVASHFRDVARGGPGYSKTDPKSEAPDDKTTLLYLGGYSLGRIPNRERTTVWKWVSGLLHDVTTWDEQKEMRSRFTELRRVKKLLDDELAVITLRRIVPGKCRYCPI